MNENIYAVIIDDEDSFLSYFELLLKTEYPDIVVMGTAKNVKSAIEIINSKKPQLVFLDVNMPDGMGFDVLDQVTHKNFEVIFTTSYTMYAIRAFEVAALHYLVKPITSEKLQEAIKRYSSKNENSNFKMQMQVFRESILETPQKLLLPCLDGMKLFNISDIIYCEAEGSYAHIYFVNNTKEMVSRPLTAFENILSELDFARIHHKYLVNMKYITKVKSQKTPIVHVQSGQALPVSKMHHKEFKEKLAKYAKFPHYP
jgi:two-component system LytT family response regulator